jgi:hypothetical protein
LANRGQFSKIGDSSQEVARRGDSKRGQFSRRCLVKEGQRGTVLKKMPGEGRAERDSSQKGTRRSKDREGQFSKMRSSPESKILIKLRQRFLKLNTLNIQPKGIFTGGIYKW